jgi:hypothetical protein
MTCSSLQYGTQTALDVRDSSANSTTTAANVKTLGDLLELLEKNPPPELPTLRTTCCRLVDYLDGKPIDQVTVDSVCENRDGFRAFLKGRNYKENSIRSYVNHARILINSARELGWRPNEAVPEEWRGVLALAAGKRCAEIVIYLARIRKMPKDVTIEDVDQWAQIRIQQGLSFDRARSKKTWFWRLLRDCGCTKQTPKCILREKNYGVPIKQFPLRLKKEVLELLRWKRAEYSLDRPKDGRHREVTSKRLRQVICAVVGYAINIRDEQNVESLPQIVQKRMIGGFVEWCINERDVKGQTLQRNLRLLSAAMHQHPTYESLDFSWFKPLLDGIPTERESELRKKKAGKYLEYKVVESIPAKIRAERPSAARKGIHRGSLLVMEELLMKWLVTLPWRQRNIRECRIGGSEPNLFQGKIPPFSDIDKPEWVQQEEQKNPEAKFWQFRFSPDETKTGNEVNALLPRPLIGLLEEYLGEFRPHLVHGADPGTLFLNRAGNPLSLSQMTRTVGDLTLRHGGRRVTPHPFRDIVAYTWLKEHPEDFLTLSKMLWHHNINTTIGTYGSRFNESSGVCAMESWLEEREAKSKKPVSSRF